MFCALFKLVRTHSRSHIQVLVPCDTDDSKFRFCYLFFLLVGSLVLIGGDPGVGKSTLVLQV